MPIPNEEFTLRIPGSIANIGPGFDTLAVAVQLYLTLRVRRGEGEGKLNFRFVNCKLEGENYIERALRYIAARNGFPIPSLDVEVESDIPMKAGLGSSAAATVGGLRLYEAVASPVDEQELLTTACELEGHPDNIAAALLGGLTVSCEVPGALRVLRASWPESLAIIVATPDLRLSTSASRAVLPEKVTRADAIFNVQRVAFLLEALRVSDFVLLKEALEDRLHQPYRAAIVPGLEEALKLKHPSLLGVCLSGAGPSVMAMAQQHLDEIAAMLEEIYTRKSIPCTVRVLQVHPTQAKSASAQHTYCVDTASSWRA
ncbi:MAG: homoserine kinase [Acidobacteriota bacterium]|nr:homoserine kinase [Acidobacteriota bacterium]